MPIPEYRQNKLVSAVTGIAPQDQSGQILAETAGNIAGAGTNDILKYAAQQKELTDSINVLEKATEYDLATRELSEEVQRDTADDPDKSMREYVSRASALSGRMINDDDSPEVRAAFQRATHGIDRSNIGHMSNWAVNRKNSILVGKYDRLVGMTSQQIKKDVANGGSIEVLFDQLNKANAVQTALGGSRKNLIDALNVTNPGMDSKKLTDQTQDALVGSYINAQMQHNPAVLFAEVTQGKFSHFFDSGEIKTLQADALSATKTKGWNESFAMQTLAIDNSKKYYMQYDALLKGVNLTPGVSMEAPDIANDIAGANQIIVNAEAQKVELLKAGATNKDLAFADAQIKNAERYRDILKQQRSNFIRSGDIEQKPDFHKMALMDFAVNNSLQEVIEDPGGKNIAAVFNFMEKVEESYGKGELTNAWYSETMGMVIPTLHEAIREVKHRRNWGPKPLQASVSQVNIGVDNFSTDKENPTRSMLSYLSYRNMWGKMKEIEANGETITREVGETIGNDAVVRAMIEVGIIAPGAHLYTDPVSALQVPIVNRDGYLSISFHAVKIQEDAARKAAQGQGQPRPEYRKELGLGVGSYLDSIEEFKKQKKEKAKKAAEQEASDAKKKKFDEGADKRAEVDKAMENFNRQQTAADKAAAVEAFQKGLPKSRVEVESNKWLEDVFGPGGIKY